MDKIKTRELPHVCKKHIEKVILKDEDTPSKPNRVKVNKVKTYNPSIERGMLGGKSLMKQANYLLDTGKWDEAEHDHATNLVVTVDRDYADLKEAKDTGPSLTRLCNRIDTYEPQKIKESPKGEKEME